MRRNSYQFPGRPIATYRKKQLDWSSFWLLTLILAVIVLVPLFYGFYRYYIGYTQFGPAAAIAWSRTWYLLATLDLLIFCIFLANSLKKSHKIITVHRKGLRIRNRKTLSYAWDQISGVSFAAVQPYFFGYHLKPRYSANLYMEGKEPIHLDHRIQELQELTYQIKEFIYPQLKHALPKNFQRGDWLEFGPIAIQRERLRVRGTEIDWNRINSLSIQAGYLVVELANQPKIQVPVIQIPNIELLLELIRTGVRA